MSTIRALTARASGLTCAALAGLALSLAAAPALADFRGGGAAFSFTPTCAENGWFQSGTAFPVLVRLRDREVTPQDTASSLTVSFGNGVVNISAWNSTLHPTANFRGLSGRHVFGNFQFWSPRPGVRVNERVITSLLDPTGPETLANARSIAIRVRINNFGGVSGCAGTIAAALRRRE